MSATSDKLVERYLKHLEVELDDLPRDRRREIVDEISGHIAEARADLEHETESDVRNILEGLGDPAEIASDARERFEVAPAPKPRRASRAAVEVGALIMLLVGGLILPVVGWLIGVVLLWVVERLEHARQDHRDDLRPRRARAFGFVLARDPQLWAASGCGQVGRRVGSSRFDERLRRSAEPSGGETCSASPLLDRAPACAPIVTTAYLAYRMRRARRSPSPESVLYL